MAGYSSIIFVENISLKLYSLYITLFEEKDQKHRHKKKKKKKSGQIKRKS